MSEYHGWTHRTKRSGGTDPIPGLGNLPWIAANGLYDSDATPTLDSSADAALWTGVYMDEDSVTESYFRYTVHAGSAYNGEDGYQLEILQPGLYTYSLMASTSDLIDGNSYDLFIALQLIDSPGNFAFYPNAFDLGYGTDYVVWERPVKTVSPSSGHVIFLNSITTPIKPPVNTNKTGAVRLDFDKTGLSTTTWTFKLWITRHGDITWAADNFETPTAGF